MNENNPSTVGELIQERIDTLKESLEGFEGEALFDKWVLGSRNSTRKEIEFLESIKIYMK
jgi:hypothetical protein